MNAEQYEPYFTHFTPLAKAWLTELKAALAAETGLQMGEIELVDHDVDQGWGFNVPDKPHLYVELMLTDGDEHGFGGVGLQAECSTRLLGLIWAPYTWTDCGGTTDFAELTEKLAPANTPLRHLASTIWREWQNTEVEIAQLATESQPAPG